MRLARSKSCARRQMPDTAHQKKKLQLAIKPMVETRRAQKRVPSIKPAPSPVLTSADQGASTVATACAQKISSRRAHHRRCRQSYAYSTHHHHHHPVKRVCPGQRRSACSAPLPEPQRVHPAAPGERRLAGGLSSPVEASARAEDIGKCRIAVWWSRIFVIRLPEASALLGLEAEPRPCNLSVCVSLVSILLGVDKK